jgi:hypothetical protein
MSDDKRFKEVRDIPETFDGKNKPLRILSARERQLAGLRPPFKPGEVHNPLGRPKGSRNRLAEYMVRDFCESWEKMVRKPLKRFEKRSQLIMLGLPRS